MERTISSKAKIRYLILGYYQIIGGVIGILLNIYGFFTQLPVFGLVIIIPVIFFILYGFSIYCGTKCLQFGENSLNVSIYNQVFQILGFSMFGAVFSYVAGLHFNINLDLSNSIQANFKAGISNFKLYYNQDPDVIKVNLNLIAIGLIIFIDKLNSTSKKEKEALK
ncbi:MAG: hypothetical protein KAY50_02275 [Chitinophagaceae bacterium]|nr:hypothetical protein [Chitinophagaceae bacterium]